MSTSSQLSNGPMQSSAFPHSLLRLLERHTLSLFVMAFAITISLVVWFLSYSSSDIVQKGALQEAALYSRALAEFAANCGSLTNSHLAANSA